jgi:hypothetical protein
MKRHMLFLIILLLLYSGTDAAQVVVSWNAASPTPNKYKLFQRIEGQTYNYSTPIYEGVGTVRQTVLTGLTNNTKYYYVVKACVGNDESYATMENSVTALDSSSTNTALLFDGAWYKRAANEYYGTTNQKIRCSWTPVGTAAAYEVRLYSLDRNSEVIISNGKVTVPTIVFTLPKTGHYSVKVRSCKADYSECSDWSVSTNSVDTTIGTDASPWIIYGNVASPGAIIIN